jgi:hypothetical protein
VIRKKKRMEIELIHKDLAKLLLRAGDADFPGAIQLHSRANVKLCIFQTGDVPSDYSVGNAMASATSSSSDSRLAVMIRDGSEGTLFDAPTPNVAVTVPTSNIPYVCVGEATQELLVGAGDLNSVHFAALDMALLSMRKGETSIFAARRKLGYTSFGNWGGDDLIFKVEVVEVSNEIDLLPPRQITKHVIRRPSDPETDAYGFQSPVYGSTAKCIVMEVHRFTEKLGGRREETVEVGGPDTPDWETVALMNMQAGEFATVRVASTGSIFKIRLMDFTNPEPPRTIDKLLEKMNGLKISGNLMIESKSPRAYVRYEAALYWMRLMRPRLLPDLSLNPTAAAQLQELEAILEGNISQVHLNNGKFEEALAHAAKAVAVDPKRYKNFFRRAKAKKGLRQYQEALLDLNRAQTILEAMQIATDSPEWKDIDEERFDIDCMTI